MFLVRSVCLFVCLSVCPSDYSQICERILTKFFGGVYRAWLKDQVIQFWWRSGSRFGSGSPKSEIRILRIGGGLCSLSAFLVWSSIRNRWNFLIGWNFKSHVNLTLTSDDLESHIVVNVSSTLTNLLFGLWLHWVWLWTYVRMYVRTDGRTDVRTDGRTFSPGLLGHLSGDDVKRTSFKEFSG